MTHRATSQPIKAQSTVHGRWMLYVCTTLMASCGAHDGKDAGPPSQVVASVGGDEITESQVNLVLQQQTSLKPEQLEPASRQALVSLVDQDILLRKARELKLDRDQSVVQSIEANKRSLIAQAYLERIGHGTAKPTPAEIGQYYDDNPELFAQRRIYSFQESVIDANETQRAAIEKKLTELKTPAELDNYLKDNKIHARGERTTVAAENVPLPVLKRVAKLKAGQGLIVPSQSGLRVLVLLEAAERPITEEQAKPAINAFLLGQRKRLAVQKEIAALRADAKVTYYGKYADLAASAPASAVHTGSATSSARVALSSSAQ